MHFYGQVLPVGVPVKAMPPTVELGITSCVRAGKFYNASTITQYTTPIYIGELF